MRKPEAWLECISCGEVYPAAEERYNCSCGDLLDVKIDLGSAGVSRKLFDSRLNPAVYPSGSGVWRYKEIVHPLAADKEIVSRGEGNTGIYAHKKLDAFTGAKVIAKHEGENPTGSFKDRGMTVGVTEARRQKAKRVCCASTGNTSASLASYAAIAGLGCVVFIPEGRIALGKLAQALAYGARVFQIKGDFDSAMKLVQEAASELGMYLLNSINPWRIEGQKTIAFELVQQLKWNSPDWIVVPAGNLGNTSAFGKALTELKELGLVEKMPKLAAVQAAGANPFYRLLKEGKSEIEPVKAETIATAIKIGNPLSWKKAARAVRQTRGVVEQVTDQEIMDAKAIVDSCGIGCEPASAASVAGAKKLVRKGVIKEGETVACILTGNLLKDPGATVNYHLGKLRGIRGRYANFPKAIEPSVGALRKYLVRENG